MAEIKSRIRVKRCTNTSLSSHLEDILPAGAPLYNTDTGELFVGDGIKKLNNRYSSDESSKLDSISASKLLSGADASEKRNTLGINPMFAYLENGPFKVDSVRLKSGVATLDVELNCASGKGISIGPATFNSSDINKNTLTKESVLLNASIESRSSAMSGEGAVAVGRTTDPANSLKASGLNSIAIGTNAQSMAEGAIAIGNGTKATEKDQVVLGNYDFSNILENDNKTCKKASILSTAYGNGGPIQKLPCTITQDTAGTITYVVHSTLDEWTETSSIADSYKKFTGYCLPLYLSGNNISYLITAQTEFGIKSSNKQIYVTISNNSLKQLLNVPDNKSLIVSFASISRLVGENEYNIPESDSTGAQSFASAINSNSDIVCSNGKSCGVFQLMAICTVA